MGACMSKGSTTDQPKKKVPKGYTRFKMDEEPQKTEGGEAPAAN